MRSISCAARRHPGIEDLDARHPGSRRKLAAEPPRQNLSLVLHKKDVKVEDGIVYLPLYMASLLVRRDRVDPSQQALHLK